MTTATRETLEEWERRTAATTITFMRDEARSYLHEIQRDPTNPYVHDWAQVGAFLTALLAAVEITETAPAADVVRVADAYEVAYLRVVNRRDAVEERRAADRAEALRQEGLALRVECPLCGQPKGQRCRKQSASRAPRSHHINRLRAARSLLSADV